ncbi:hypothetical protein N7U49_35205 [Streptomyces sp. AD2-2]|nr:hypothetical protein N7U49_35205 [Streptomyces sp. AD2-2]
MAASHTNEMTSVWPDSEESGFVTETAPSTTKYARVLISRTRASKPTPRRRSFSIISSPVTRPPRAPQRQSKEERTPATIQGANPGR